MMTCVCEHPILAPGHYYKAVWYYKPLATITRLLATTSPWPLLQSCLLLQAPSHYYKAVCCYKHLATITRLSVATSTWPLLQGCWLLQAPGHYFHPLTTALYFSILVPQLRCPAPLRTPPPLPRPHSTAPTAHGCSTTKHTWTHTKLLTEQAALSVASGAGPAC